MKPLLKNFNLYQCMLLFIGLFFCFITSVYAIDITLRWDANTEPDLQGYKLYYKIGSHGPPYNGTGAMEGDSPIIIPLVELYNPEQPEYTIHGLDENEIYYLAATAYDIDGLESGYSNEVYFDATYSREAGEGGFDIYFPHIASDGAWETEICIINTSFEQNLNGDLKAYADSGQELSSTFITLATHAQRKIIVSDMFPNPSNIGYVVFQSDSKDVIGYTKFYIKGKYRVAVPAASKVNTKDIYIPHIKSDTNWWTGISILNTTPLPTELTFEFDNGMTKSITISAKEHQAFTIQSLFGDVPQPEIHAAVIKNANGIVGLELFGSTDNSENNYLSGVLLTDETATHIYYPHIASNSTWWTEIVLYNPSDTACTLTITPFTPDGTSLSSQTMILSGKEKYVSRIEALNFPEEAVWFKIDANSPVTGFELFGTSDGNQLGGYTAVGIGGTNGVFAKIEKDGWTGIAFANTEGVSATVTMTAYDDSGNVIAAETLDLNAYEKLAELAANLFSQDINAASHIGYSSNRNVVGFQLNGSSDGMMLDGIPGMK